ncbi:MAG: hypothetical protein ACOZIN_01160 [Myxococcota bacterium]
MEKWLDALQLVPLVLGAFWLWKLKQEEMLKTRLQLVMEIWEAFSDLHLAVFHWVNGVRSPEQFEEEMASIFPRTLKAFQRARLLMHPDLVEQIDGVFSRLAELRAHHGNYEIYRGQNKDAPGAYVREMNDSWTKAKKELPATLDKTLEQLHRELQGFILGRWTAWRWARLRISYLKQKSPGALGAGSLARVA